MSCGGGWLRVCLSAAQAIANRACDPVSLWRVPYTQQCLRTPACMHLIGYTDDKQTQVLWVWLQVVTPPPTPTPARTRPLSLPTSSAASFLAVC